jgi:hypothetical protein
VWDPVLSYRRLVDGLAHRLDALAEGRGARRVPFAQSRLQAEELLRWVRDDEERGVRVR